MQSSCSGIFPNQVSNLILWYLYDISLSAGDTLCNFSLAFPSDNPTTNTFFPTTTVSKHVLPISHSNCLPGWPTSAGLKRFLPGPVHLLARESAGLYDDLVAAGIRLTPWECPKAKTVGNRRGGLCDLIVRNLEHFRFDPQSDRDVYGHSW